MVETTSHIERRVMPDKTLGQIFVDNPSVSARNVDVFYGDKHAIDDISLDIGASQVISFIGPSGCGKSTFLRCLNRMNDTIDICRVEGEIKIDGRNIYDPLIDVVSLRARVGMVFRRRIPFLNQFLTTSHTDQPYMG